MAQWSLPVNALPMLLGRRSVNGIALMLACLSILGLGTHNPCNCLQAAEPAPLNWPQWRGPTANGIADPQSQPPTQWSREQNIAWVRDLPGEGSATPIVWNDHIYVLSAEATGKKSDQPTVVDPESKTMPPNEFYRFVVSCLNLTSGDVVWERVAAEQVPHEGKHGTHTYAAGSPCTDGQLVYASFGSRGIFAYTLNGDLVWQVDLGDMRTRYGWGEAVTPVIADDKLIINWDQETGSFITALDKKTGQVIWRTERPEEVTSWNTPLVTKFNNRTLVIVNGTHRATAYDAKDGAIVWSCGGQTVNAIPSPIRFEDVAICMSGYRSAAGFAIPLGSTGDVTDATTLRFKLKQGTPYVPSPVISGDRLMFTAGSADVLTCVSAKTGEPLLPRKRLGGVGSLYSSPLVAGGHIYFVGREGTTVVLKDNAALDTVAVNDLGEPSDASPVAVGNRLLIRSWRKLFCIQATDIQKQK